MRWPETVAKTCDGGPVEVSDVCRSRTPGPTKRTNRAAVGRGAARRADVRTSQRTHDFMAYMFWRMRSHACIKLRLSSSSHTTLNTLIRPTHAVFDRNTTRGTSNHVVPPHPHAPEPRVPIHPSIRPPILAL